MQCNIDAKGKAVRLITGAILIALAALVIAALLLGALGADWWWWFAGALALFGAFGVFEGARGWCALRAMGVRTRL